jgi:hypothetical protein
MNSSAKSQGLAAFFAVMASLAPLLAGCSNPAATGAATTLSGMNYDPEGVATDGTHLYVTDRIMNTAGGYVKLIQ